MKGIATMTTALIEAGTDLVVQSSVKSAIEGLRNGSGGVFSTFQGDDFATKVAVVSAVTDADPVSENLGKTIKLANVVMQAIEMPDEKTGELVEVPRIILIDDEGKAYAAISSGIFKSLENIFGILGQPHTWNGPLPIQIVEKKSRAGFRFMTIQIVTEPEVPAKK